MDPKPFRCVYDPELSRSKSQGNKPIYTRPRLDHKSGDPRLERAHQTKGRVPPKGPLPLPKFANKVAKPVLRRCLITGIGPLVSRSRLYDLVREFGVVEDCQIVVSRTTGASLGIAWVLYGPNEREAARSLVKSGEQGLLDINGQGSRVNVQLDASGDLLKEAEQAAEKSWAPLAGNRTANGNASLDAAVNGGDAKDKGDLKLVELRNLAPAQVTQWYDKFVGLEATYVLLHDVCVSVWDHSVDEVASAFREFPVKHIAVNRTGFFICFDAGPDAVRCYLKMHRKFLFGVPLKLKMTVKGRRLSHDQVLQYRDKELGHANGQVSGTLASSKTLRPGTARTPLAPRTYDEAAARILTDVSQEMKRKAWPKLLATFVNSIVEEELEKLWKSEEATDSQAVGSESPADDDEDSDSDSGSNPDSRDSTPAYQQNGSSVQAVGLGTRRGGAMGMTARALPGYGMVRPLSQLPGLRIRKRNSDDASLHQTSNKKRKPLQVTASAPNSYIRAPIKAVPDNGSVKMDMPKKEVPEGLDHMDVDSSDDEDRSQAADSPLKSEMEIEDEEEEVDDDEGMGLEDEKSDDDEESDEEERGMALPVSPASEGEFAAPGPIYNRIQKLVKSSEDLSTLKMHLNTIELPPIREDEILEAFAESLRPVLRRDEGINWPLSKDDLPFRLAPYRNRPDDERRQYLHNLGPGVPNEIVQSYKERPLYEGADEIEEEDQRTETRALNVSRSAFGVNADLFADDNLSKNAKDTRLARSAIHDWGLYANELIPANDFVIEYVGDILRDEYAEIRERNYAMEGIDSTYLFRLDNGTVIDATKRGNGARFINHSCDPNCTAQVFDYEGYKRVVLFSLRDIEPDEELTFDYNFVRSQDETGKVRCACGAANCRGWLM